MTGALSKSPIPRRAPVLLVIDDEELARKSVCRLARHHGFDVLTAGAAEEGLVILDDPDHDVDVVLVDQGLPNMQGTEFIGVARQQYPEVDYILFTGTGDVALGYEAQQLGASDYFIKPIADHDRFLQVLRRGVEAKRLRAENASLRTRERGSPTDRLLLGHSAAMEQLRDKVRRVASRPARTLLVTGETGTGKDVVAQAIHAEMGGELPYVPVNCAEFSESELTKSALFGHERGAYTGAIARHRGHFERAGRGIVFLDEIGELELEVQAKLLRAVESDFRRVGGEDDLVFEGRIIMATNRDLGAMVKEGRFREDLYYRLNSVQLRLPPLRQHREDIPLLAYYFAKSFAERFGKQFTDIHPDALRALMAHDWPGNVRELRGAVERMVVWSDGEVLEPTALGPDILAATPAVQRADAPADPQALHYPEALLDRDLVATRRALGRAFTRWYLARKLQEAEGVRADAARTSGQGRTNFQRSLREHGVTWPLPDGLLRPDGQLDWSLDDLDD
ncbi:MAG: sigma-54 dependent transcriptional regulator [Myxococcota bacterium]